MKHLRKAALFLSMILIVLTAAGCGGDKPSNSNDPGSTVKVKTLRISHNGSDSFHLNRALLECLKPELEATGHFKVEVYANGSLGSDTEILEMAKTGDLNMNITPTSYYVDENPALALVELPYAFPSKDVAISVLQGEWGREQLDKLASANLYGLGYMENGYRHLTNNPREVRLPTDVKGLKLRTMSVPAHVYFWNSLNASAEGAPFSELYTNLSTGVFDGQENPIAHIYSSKLYEVQNYLTLTGHCYSVYLGSVNLDYWNSLTEEEQGMLRTAWDNCFQYQLNMIAEEESQQLEEMRDNKNFPTEIIELTDEERAAWIEAAKPTQEHFKETAGQEEYDKFLAAVAAAQQ